MLRLKPDSVIPASWELAQPARRKLPLALIGIAAMQLLQFVNPYIFKEIIDSFTSLDRASIGHILQLIAASFLVSMAMNGVKFWRDTRVFGVLLTLERIIPIRAQEKLVELSMAFHERSNSGNTVVKVQRGTDTFIHLAATFFFDFLPTVLQTIATFVLLLTLNWKIALIFCSVVPLYFFITIRVNRRIHPMRRDRHESYEVAAGVMSQTVMNMQTVQAFCQEEQEVDRLQQIRERIFRAESFEWRTLLSANVIRDSIINVGRVAVLLASVWFALRGEITIGSLVLFLSLSEQAYFALFRITRIFDITSEGAEAIVRLTRLLRETSNVQDAPNAVALTQVRGAIEFDGVSFSYPGGNDALDNVQFHVQPGTTVALVGPSGSGKSTIVSLLFRHHDPQRGRVLIDGIDLRHAARASFRSQMAIVPQDVEIFDRSIRDNIAFARPEATDAEVCDAAELAAAHEFIVELPEGYETLVGERGVRLSGGQRQRIGIARAILANPKILVFDEATSQLDSHSERLIQTALERIRHGRTTILIAHRLSTVQRADRILVLDRGKIIERGSHADLLEQSGLYAELHQLQTEGALVT